MSDEVRIDGGGGDPQRNVAIDWGRWGAKIPDWARDSLRWATAWRVVRIVQGKEKDIPGQLGWILSDFRCGGGVSKSR